MIKPDSIGVLTILFVLCSQDHVQGEYGTPCPKNPILDLEVPGNTYFCPFENPDGTVNVYTECCFNDRPDQDGNYYSCCQSDADKEAQRSAKMQTIGFAIGGVCAVIVLVVFILTYCRSDTFPFVTQVKEKVFFWWKWTSDHVCFCLCCKEDLQRKEKLDIEEVAVQDKTTFELW